MSLLELRNLTLRFGGLTAVNGVSFRVEPKQVFAVIGPNGAGKTSLFNAVTGVYEPTSGEILLRGRDVSRPFTARTAFGILLIGVLTFAGVLLGLNIESVWENAIALNYVYQEPFPWGKAFSDLGSQIGLLLSGSSVRLPLLSALLGAAGAAIAWERSRRSPEVVSRSGVSRTFQNIRLFQQMTVLENVLVGMDPLLKENVADALLRLPRHFRESKSSRKKALELLVFVGLEEFADAYASALPYGHQRRLEIARALASDPELLLLDEPAAGMNPSEAVELMSLIERIKASGVTILLIEHHMRVVMGVSDRIAVLDYGNKIAEGTPEEIRCNPSVIKAYLGAEES